MKMLDNYVSHALTTNHQHFAIGGVLARRYSADITPFAGMIETSPESLAELASITLVGDMLAVTGFEKLHKNAAFPSVFIRRRDS